ncbi:hypothetical protein KI387_029833, partial [Taxus chinensis]
MDQRDIEESLELRREMDIEGFEYIIGDNDLQHMVLQKLGKCNREFPSDSNESMLEDSMRMEDAHIMPPRHLSLTL